MISDHHAVEAAAYLISKGFSVCHCDDYCPYNECSPQSAGEISADHDGWCARVYRIPRERYVQWRSWVDDGCPCTADNNRGRPCGKVSISDWHSAKPDQFIHGIDDRCSHHQEPPLEVADA